MLLDSFFVMGFSLLSAQQFLKRETEVCEIQNHLLCGWCSKLLYKKITFPLVSWQDFNNHCTGQNDDGGSGYNFSYAVSLKASQIVYFFVTEKDMSDNTQYEVCVEKLY